MPDRKKKPPTQQSQSIKELEAKLRAIGFHPAPFIDLIDRAVRSRWSTERLIVEIRGSDPFQRMFPGIPDTMSPVEYRQVEQKYREVAADFGIHLDHQRLGLLFQNAKSPDEFYNDALIFDAVHKTDGLRQAFNQVLTAGGRKAVDKQGWFNFIAGRAPAHVYDLYEAASLKAADIGLSGGEARQLGRVVGQPGQLASVQQIAANVRALQNEVQPELARQGITAADIAMLEAGADPLGIAPTVQRIVDSHRALGGSVAALGARRVSGSPTVGLFPALEEGR